MSESEITESTQRTSKRSAVAVNVVPFNTCLLMVLSAGFILFLMQILVHTAVAPLAAVIATFATFFMFEWYVLHFTSMTRTRRACFDVANVLETYQPRARTMGHLFNPEPPTPCVKIDDKAADGHESSKEKNEFTNARDAHYENMYQKALQMAKEMEEVEKVCEKDDEGTVLDFSSQAAAKETMDCSQNVDLKPADPTKDKKEYDEKKKKENDKYKAESSKPLNC